MRNWGNSLASRIPKYISQQLQLSNSSLVEISLDDDKIVIKPVKASDYSLDDFLKKLKDKNMHEKIDYGEPVGCERNNR